MGQEDTENISYIIDGTGPDGKAEIGTDDLKQDVKMTVAHFLHSLTTEAPTANKYSVPDGLTEGNLTDANGNPADIQTGGPYRKSAFSLDPTLDQYSNPFLDAFAEEIRVRDYLTKGENGNTLLQDVNGEAVNRTGKATAEDGDTPVQKQVSQVLRSNRFNPTPGSTPYVTGDKVPDPPRVIPNQSSLGAYRDPETGELLASVISIDELRKVGLSLMLRASGDDLGDPSDPDSVTGLLPSPVQLGVSRVDPVNLEAKSAYPLASVDRVSLDSDFPRTTGDVGSKSYGNLNSYLEPFDAFQPTGMVLLAATATVSTFAVLQGLIATISGIGDKSGKSASSGSPAPGTYQLGRSTPIKTGGTEQLTEYFAARSLGLAPTKNDYGRCVERGINVFFGMPAGTQITNEAVAGLATNIQTAPGYYAIHMRAIYRSAIEFGVRAADINFSNLAGARQQVISIIDLVRSSKVVSFINVCASLGDFALTMESKGYVVDPTSDEIVKISDVDGFSSRIAGATVKKSRTEKNLSNIALSWRTSSSRSALLVPGGLLNKVVKQNDSVNRRLGGLAAISDYAAQGSGNGNRIAPDEVRRIEGALDSEYVPFYFHDLRTNEILSFHAFLTSLNDNFTANYDAVDGYGRIDPVQIYRSTNREISLGFFVASTSREDFDVMWWKINKLVTLVYPQWSSGRNVKTNGGTSFTQPFSQIPTASPLVRMRVGDVVRSNYSKFNLKRLFGNVEAANASETSNAQAGGQSDTAYGSVLNQFGADVNGAKSTIANNPQGQKFLLRPRGYGLPYRRRNGDRVSLVTDKEITVTVQEKISDNVFMVSVEDLSIDDLMVTINDLRYDPASLISATTSVASEDGEQVVNEIATDAASFFSADSNPIVKAFESTAGKGLAGVIKTINFNWFEPTWEIDSGAKAPQWCRIEMSFSPIHDIPPGLDDEGFNRAPVYPVGAVSNFVFSEDEVDTPPAAVEQSKDASNGDAEETIMQIATEIALRQAGVI